MSFKSWLFLLCLYLLYLTLGMWLFNSIECPNEIQDQDEEMSKAIAAHQDLEEIRASLDSHDEEMLNELFKTMHSDLYPFYQVVLGTDIYSSNDSSDKFLNLTQTCQKWSMYNSFFFSLTAITTIGYGHISPTTSNGRLVCIFYCLVGVPLNAILIGTLGNFFSIRAIKLKTKFSEYQNGIKWELESLHVVSRIILEGTLWIVLGILLFMILPATIFYLLEGQKGLDFDGHDRWNYTDSLYYTFITLSTIGFGDMVAARQMTQHARDSYKYVNIDDVKMFFYNVFIIMWILLGMGYIYMIVNVMAQAIQSTGKPMKKAIQSMKNQIHVSDYWKNIITELTLLKNSEDEGSVGSLVNGIVSSESNPCLGDMMVNGLSEDTARKVKSTSDLNSLVGSETTPASGRKVSFQEDSNSLHIPNTIQELNEDTIRSLRDFLETTRLGNNMMNSSSSSASTRPVTRQHSNNSLAAMPRLRKPSLSRTKNTEDRDQSDGNHQTGFPPRSVSRTSSTVSNKSGGRVNQNGAIGHLLEQTTLAQFLTAAENVRKRSTNEMPALQFEENFKHPRKLSESKSIQDEPRTIPQMTSAVASMNNKNDARRGSMVQESSESETPRTSVGELSLGRFDGQPSTGDVKKLAPENPTVTVIVDDVV